MFHKLTGLLTATFMLFGAIAQPMTARATEPVNAVPVSLSDTSKTAKLAVSEVSFLEIRKETKSKLSKSQKWVKDNTPHIPVKEAVKDLELKVDRLQDRAKTMGRPLKKSLKNSVRGDGIIKSVDQRFTAFGILLVLAFASVLALLSLSSPNSRLGGRH